MVIHLTEEREECREDSDVPACENENGRNISPTLVDDAFRKKYPCACVCDGEEDIK